MQGTVEYTLYDGFRVGGTAYVMADEIESITPADRGGCSHIMLKSGRHIHTATGTDELLRRLDAARQDIWRARWHYFKRVMQVTLKLADADSETIDNDGGRQAITAMLEEMDKTELIDDLHALRIK